MRRLPCPRSRSFRAMLGMALLAWAMLASGALAAPLYLAGAMQMATAQPADAHCDDMSLRLDTSRQMPMTPVGHGDCCHGSCHCLSVYNAVLTVPASTVAVPLPSAAVPKIVFAGLSAEPAAPPLRPPIA